MVPTMSPLLTVEAEAFSDIATSLRRWADALESHAERAAKVELGPRWSDADLVELYETWVRVGHALRDVARTRPEHAGAGPRREVLAIRDGLGQIADVVERQP